MLISDEYRAQQEELHKNPNYGVASVQFAPLVTKFVNRIEAKSLLDWGAGKGRLMQNIHPDQDIEVTCFDPAVPGWDKVPEGLFDIVTCIDVLEHIEPDCLAETLDSLRDRTGQIAFLTVHTGPAIKTLPDGRNAHLIQQPPEWWLPQIMGRWDLLTFQRITHGFWVLCQSRPTAN